MEEVALGRFRQWVGRGEVGSLPLPTFGHVGSAGEFNLPDPQPNTPQQLSANN